jgi:formate-dependent nitrite reductase membrane component NrfD
VIQSKPWEFMVKYTPQRDWIEGHGIMVAFAIFFGGIAGGLYLASLYFDSTIGMFVAWLLAMATGLTDMAHLSKPKRFWRMLLRVRSSWITRGFLFITLFIGAAAVQLALRQWTDLTALQTVFKVIAGVMAFGVAIYSGFVVGFVGAIKLWNSAIVPLLFVVAGLAGGLGILLLASQGGPDARVLDIARGCFYVLVGYAVFTAIYLWVSTYENTNARDSVKRILTGEVSRVFWLVVVVIGMVVPLGLIAPYAFSGVASAPAYIISGACIIVGGVGLRYVILKAGVYSPLVPISE